MVLTQHLMVVVIVPCWMMVIAFSCFSISFAQAQENVLVEQHYRPKIYTFFERIPSEQDRFTSMTDEDDDALLEFWKKMWKEAGWDPHVISLKDAENHPEFPTFHQKVLKLNLLDPFLSLQFLKFFVMGVVVATAEQQQQQEEEGVDGGVATNVTTTTTKPTKISWLADYDVFPIRDFRSYNDDNDSGTTTTRHDRVVCHEIYAPSLASGTSSKAWFRVANALIEDAKLYVSSNNNNNNNNANYFTDSLALLNLMRDYPDFQQHLGSTRNVAFGNKLMVQNMTTTDDEEEKDSICRKRFIRNKWAVHFSPRIILEGYIRDPELRLPKHRITVAKETLETFYKVCGHPLLSNVI